MGKARTQEEFIALVQKAWGDKLDFSDTVYGKNCMEKVKVLCPKHGEFYKSPDELIRKHSGCPKCGRQINAAKARKTQEEFIADVTRIHGERYDFSESVYKDRMTPVKVICKEHGPFYITPHSLLDKCGCPECARVKCQIVNLKTKEQFISDAIKKHGNKYDYSRVEYRGDRYKLEIICKKHGSFFQKPSCHLSGKGCPICRETLGESVIRKFLIERKINFIQEKSFSDCRDVIQLRFDFYIPTENTCLEYQGSQHYEEIPFFSSSGGLERRMKHDQIKRDYCASHGIRLVEIRYDQDIEEELKKQLQL